MMSRSNKLELILGLSLEILNLRVFVMRKDEQINSQPTKESSGNNTETSVPITEPLVPEVPQSQNTHHASISSYPIAQGIWSKDQHIKLINIIGEPGEGILTRSMAAKLIAVSASDCLFADFLSKIEPKKVSGALKHPGWVFKNKKDEVRTVVKNKARLVAQGFDLKGYSDSDYDGCNMDRKSTLGACQILRGKLVCWITKKQQSVAMSSAEAEYVAAVGCCANILWMKSQLSDYDIHYKMVLIFCDNTSAIAISNNPVLHSRTKHIYKISFHQGPHPKRRY
ncbi:hypothetical protein Tco_0394297 [Tanacetum coccineum]